MKWQKPCSEQSTQSAASMKGALLVLALMVTRELTFKMCEGLKEVQLALLILAPCCLTASFPVLSKPLLGQILRAGGRSVPRSPAQIS